MGYMLGEIAFIAITAVIAVITLGLLGLIASKAKIYNPKTNGKVKELLKKEREIYMQINEELDNTGIVNKIILRWKMGKPLYEWYKGGFIK